MTENQKERKKRLFLNAVNSLNLESPNAEIADRIGYDRGNLSRILNGNASPSTTVVQRFEEEFGVNIEDFDEMEKEKPPKIDIRLEDLIARGLLEELKPYLKDFQEGHISTGKQVHELTEVVKSIAKRIVLLHNKVELMEKEMKDIKLYCKDVHEVVSSTK